MKSLIKTTYYVADFDDGKVLHVHQSPHTETSKRDRLDSWLDENTYGKFDAREFHGSNGVYCLLSMSEREIGNKTKIKAELKRNKRKGVERPYTHIVKITSQPSDRNLPPELLHALDDMGYKRADPNMFK